MKEFESTLLARLNTDGSAIVFSGKTNFGYGLLKLNCDGVPVANFGASGNGLSYLFTSAQSHSGSFPRIALEPQAYPSIYVGGEAYLNGYHVTKSHR